MRDTNKLELEQVAVEGIKGKIAGKLSDLLTGTAEKSKGLCATIMWGEPTYPIELLTEK